MSEIRTELDRIISQVEEGHSKATAKGATPQSSKTLANLLTAIDTIPEATAPKLQAKTATPSETAQTVKPDSGYDGLSQVSVGAISKTYVGSGVTKQAAKTITPSTSSQTAVASGVYTTGAVTVAAIPSTYVKPTATKAATTYTPSTSNQTIAAGTYCSGAQTIKGDANLVAGNIKSGVSIFGVAGTMTAGEDVTSETNTYTSLLDDLEAAVDSLPDAGGGAVDTGMQLLDSGTTKSSTNKSSVTITHKCGKIPKVAVICSTGTTATYMIVQHFEVRNGDSKDVFQTHTTNTATYYSHSEVYNQTMDWTDEQVILTTASSSYKFGSNKTYEWKLYG